MDNDVRQQLVQEIVEIIEEQRSEISSALSTAISEHISGKSPGQCLELVKRGPSGAVARRLPMAIDAEYAKALVAFVRGKDFEGAPLDSALTDSTSDVVADVFSTKLGEKGEEISSRMIPLIVSDQRFVNGLSEAMVASYSGPLPAHLRQKVVAIFSGKLTAALAHAIDASTTAAIKASVMKVTVASVSSPIGIKVTAAMVKALSIALKPIIMKLLASSAFKAAIVAKLKVVIVGAMLGAFFKIIGVKLGLSAGAVFLWVVLPAVVVWLAYEVSSFPRKLAEKVSEAVVADIDSNFSATSRHIADTLIERVVVEGAAILAKQFVNDDAMAELLSESVRSAA